MNVAAQTERVVWLRMAPASLDFSLEKPRYKLTISDSSEVLAFDRSSGGLFFFAAIVEHPCDVVNSEVLPIFKILFANT